MNTRPTAAIITPATAAALAVATIPAFATTAPTPAAAPARPVALSCTGYFNTTVAGLAPGQSRTAPSDHFGTSQPGTIDACLDGPRTADFDLVLQRRDPARAWVTVATAPAGGAGKVLSYTGLAGTYRLLVTAISGSGGYTVGLNRPGFSH